MTTVEILLLIGGLYVLYRVFRDPGLGNWDSSKSDYGQLVRQCSHPSHSPGYSNWSGLAGTDCRCGERIPYRDGN